MLFTAPRNIGHRQRWHRSTEQQNWLLHFGKVKCWHLALAPVTVETLIWLTFHVPEVVPAFDSNSEIIWNLKTIFKKGVSHWAKMTTKICLATWAYTETQTSQETEPESWAFKCPNFPFLDLMKETKSIRICLESFLWQSCRIEDSDLGIHLEPSLQYTVLIKCLSYFISNILASVLATAIFSGTTRGSTSTSNQHEILWKSPSLFIRNQETI